MSQNINFVINVINWERFFSVLLSLLLCSVPVPFPDLNGSVDWIRRTKITSINEKIMK